MKQVITTIGTFIIAALLLAGRAEAVSVQYALDQSNTLDDGIDYMLVTISENQPDTVDFLVETHDGITAMPVANFGIASFGFNLTNGIKLSSNDFILPDHWKVQFNKGMSVAGKFDVRLLGTGQSRQDPLTFSISGLGLGDILPGFAAHVSGFERTYGMFGSINELVVGLTTHATGTKPAYANLLEGGVPGNGNSQGGYQAAASAFFYGDKLVTAVPVPAAIWLFGSGLLLLGRIAAQRRA